MNISKSLFSELHDQIVSFVEENKDFLRFAYCISYRSKIDEMLRLGLYKSKCNYYIDKNMVNKEIKELRNKINKEKRG